MGPFAEGEAIPFVVEDCDSAGNDILCITEDARMALNEMEGPLCVVCTSGGQGLGKSDLLNRAFLGNAASGFPVGGTTGIWMWSKPIKAQASDGSDVNVLLLDAAGISNERALAGSFDMHKEAEASAADHLQTIAFLLSSCWVYESTGNLGDSAISDLASIASTISRQVRVGSADQDVDMEALSACFPKLMWVLRDVSPSHLVDDQGRILTPRQSLERAVRGDVNNSFSPTKSRARAIVRMCFEDRECFPLSPAFVRGAIGESSPGSNSPSSEYVRQLQVFGGRVLQGADPKTVNGVALSGGMLAHLADNYVMSANCDSCMSIKEAWDSVCDAECEKALSACAAFYNRTASEIREESLPLLPYDLTQWHAEVAGEAVRMFGRETKGKEGTAKYVSLLEERLRSSFRDIDAENHRIGCFKAKDALEHLYIEVDARLSDGGYSDFGAFERDRSRVRAKFLEEVPRNMHSMLVLHEFMEEKVASAATKFLSKSSEEADDSRTRLETQVESMRFGVIQQQRGLERELEELRDRLILQEEYLAAGRQREAELRSTLTSDREKLAVQLVEINQAHSRALQDALRECDEAERRRIDADFRLREAETRLASLAERRAPVPLKRKASPASPNLKQLEQDARVKEVLRKVMASLRIAVSNNVQFADRARSAAAGVASNVGESGGAVDFADAGEDDCTAQWCDSTLNALPAMVEGLHKGNEYVLRLVNDLVKASKAAKTNMIKSPSTQARPSAAVASTPGGGAADESIVWYSPMQVGQTPGVHRGTPGGGLLRRAVATPSRDALRVTPFSNQAPVEASGSARIGKVALFSLEEGAGAFGPGGGLPGMAGGILSPGHTRLPAMHEVDCSSDSLEESQAPHYFNVTSAKASPRSRSPVSDRASSPINTLEAAKFPGLGGRFTPTEASPPPEGAGAHSLAGSGADSSREGPRSAKENSASPAQNSSNSPPQMWSASTVASAGGRSVGVGPQKESGGEESVESVVYGDAVHTREALSVVNGDAVHTREALFEHVALEGVSDRIEKLERTMLAMRHLEELQAAAEAPPDEPQDEWWCFIESCATKTAEKGGRMYTEYDVRVGSVAEAPVRLGKRYSQFLELHRKLQRTFPHVVMPANTAQLFSGLRSSMWFNRFDPEFVECRRVWLEAYMLALLNTPPLARSQILQSFLQTNLLLDQAAASLSIPPAGQEPMTPVQDRAGRGGYLAPPPTQVKQAEAASHSPFDAKHASWDAAAPAGTKQATFAKWEQRHEEWMEANNLLSQTLPMTYGSNDASVQAPRGAYTPQPSRNAAAALRQARQTRLSYSPLTVVAPTQ